MGTLPPDRGHIQTEQRFTAPTHLDALPTTRGRLDGHAGRVRPALRHGAPVR